MSTRTNVLMDEHKIKELLPHRYPLLLIDSVHEFEELKRVVASKFISEDYPVFEGHFPNNPIYPGVYFIESMAQTGALLLLKNDKNNANDVVGLLSSVESARFRKPIRPGQTVQYDVTLEKSRGIFYWFSGKAYCETELVADAKFSIALTKKIKEN